MANNDKALRAVLVVVGIIFVVGVYPLTIVWPSGWIWHMSGHSTYLQMILGIYATLGVFLLLAARNPQKNLSLIWFTVWSSVVHGCIMAAQAWVYPEHRGHLLGDVPALLLIAIVLGILYAARVENGSDPDVDFAGLVGRAANWPRKMVQPNRESVFPICLGSSARIRL